MESSKKLNLNMLLFSIVCVLLTLDFLSWSFFKINNYNYIFRYATILLIVALFVINRNITLNEILVLVLFLLLFVQNSDVSINLAYLLLLSLSAKYVENDSIYKIVNIINIVIVLVVIFCLGIGLVNNVVVYVRNRNTLGFVHVNYVGLLLYSIVSSYILWKKDINVIETSIILGLILFIYMITNSRTGCLGSLILLAMYYFCKYCKDEYKKVMVVIYSLLIFAFPLIIQLPIFSNSFINIWLSKRPEIFQSFINSCTLKQFLFGGIDRTVDCFYINTLYGCGIFVYLILCFLFMLAILNKLNNNKNVELAFILTTLLVGTLESSIMRPEILCILIFWKLIIEEIEQ